MLAELKNNKIIQEIIPAFLFSDIRNFYNGPDKLFIKA